MKCQKEGLWKDMHSMRKNNNTNNNINNKIIRFELLILSYNLDKKYGIF